MSFPVNPKLVVKIVAASAVSILALAMGALALLSALGISKDNVTGFIVIFAVTIFVLVFARRGG